MPIQTSGLSGRDSRQHDADASCSSRPIQSWDKIPGLRGLAST
jgi:hypothetical protein